MVGNAVSFPFCVPEHAHGVRESAVGGAGERAASSRDPSTPGGKSLRRCDLQGNAGSPITRLMIGARGIR